MSSPIDRDRQPLERVMGVEASPEAEQRGCLTDWQGTRQRIIELQVEAGLLQRSGVWLGSDHGDERYGTQARAMFLSTVSTDRDTQAGGTSPAAAGEDAEERTTEESLRAWLLKRARAREIAALQPRPGEEPMRMAYLELLKLCLCDLAGARTLSVG